jgi:Bacterial Ig-like domain (group 3)/Autotransporter beta-domain/Immunoglobulin I-set domain
LIVLAQLASGLRRNLRSTLKRCLWVLAIVLLGAVSFPSLAAAQAPVVTTNPVSQSVAAGSNVSFVAAASGIPSPTVQWQQSTDGGATFNNIGGATSTTLTFATSVGQNGNQYRAVFTNISGSATTTAATLTVTAGPVVTTNPVDVTINAGGTAVFTAAATGAPSPTVQWQFSTDGGATFSNVAGATSTTLAVPAVTAGQNGTKFRAVFTNASGTATTTAATMTVNFAPTVTTNPVSQSVAAGSNVSFIAAASGNPSPTVQWQQSTDGGATFSNIGGATSTTLTFATGVGQNGNQYRAVFTNISGSATTIAATLTVSSGIATHLSVSAPAAATSGTGFNVTVTALDASNNIAVGYSGTVHFTSTDGAAVLPANYTFVASDSGVHTFTATLNTIGSRTITATDTVTPAITGTSGAINVTAKTSTSATLVSSLNPSAVGQTVTFTATVTGNSPTGSVTFKDGGATLGTATLGGSGQAMFSTSSLSIGSHSITAVYSGDAGNTPATSAALGQTVNTSADSLKLRALQVTVTPMVAQTSGQAISDAVSSAINEAFSEGGAIVSPSGNGVRFNFAADPDARAASTTMRSNDPFSSANGSFAEGGSALGARSTSRIDDRFNALAYAAPTKAAPLRAAEAREWFGWAEVRGATLDRWGSSTNLGVAPAASVLYGNQVNLLGGLTRKFTPNFLIGVLGGYETFDYRSDALQGRLKGDGWTVGSYLGWKITQNMRFDTAVAYSGIGYDGTAGTASGSFRGNRWMVTTGLTGTYSSYGLQIEPSARVYALWEHENAYTDTLGTLQTARDFATGRASGGVRLSYPVSWSATTVLVPYVGLYGDYYFNSDSAGAAAAAAATIPSNLILDGWSARATGGVTARFGNGAQVAIGVERAGIGGSFGLWTYRARASVPFGAQ